MEGVLPKDSSSSTRFWLNYLYFQIVSNAALYSDGNSEENVVRLPDTGAAGNENINGLIDIVNNVEQPIDREPSSFATKELSDLRTELEETIKHPSQLGGVSIASHLEKMQSKLAKPQHFHGANNERQAAVVAALKHSWAGYKKYAWGHDNLKPVSQTSHEWFGLGLSIVDSLDTIYIMGLEDGKHYRHTHLFTY